MSDTAPVLVPSLLPEDAEEWVRSFVVRLRDEVALPLFSARDPDVFAELLPDHLVRGAALRFRWWNALSEMPSERGAALRDQWMRPPPPRLLTGLLERAKGLLGAERSFLVQRALALTFTDATEAGIAVIQRWRTPDQGLRRLVEIARLWESAVQHDVLALAWMIALAGDVPLPSASVAHAAASALLDATSDRLAAIQAVLRDEVVAGDVLLDDREVPRSWLESHPGLVLPLVILVGLAVDDRSVEGVIARSSRDPEDPALSLLELRLAVRGDPDEARYRIEDRALRTGVLGALTDGRGGMLAITATGARPA